MPNNKGHFLLVSDTSGVACGAALYQEQKGRLRLFRYNSKNHFQRIEQQFDTVLVNLNYVD